MVIAFASTLDETVIRQIWLLGFGRAKEPHVPIYLRAGFLTSTRNNSALLHDCAAVIFN